MADRWTIDARWGARDEPSTALADRVARFLRAIERLHPSFTAWYVAGPGVRAPLGPEGLHALLRQDGDTTNLVLTTATRPAAQLLCALGTTAGATSRVRLTVPPPVAGAMGPAGVNATVRAAVESWDPSWASCYSAELGLAQLPAPGSVVVGRLTYLSADPAAVGAIDGVRVEALGAGSLVVADRVDQPVRDQVRAIRRALAARGLLETPGSEEASGGFGALTVHEAFLVMTDYLSACHLLGPGPVEDVLIAAAPEPDGDTSDPAAWHDWLDSVARIRSGQPPRSIFADPSESGSSGDE
ncbi:hypothetical protein [Cellulomonas pakistanensis]|uniref:hypothetical protein n=1 Tax=Cellulomonas pakistanensis TaxID=992287 RepID=UPI0019405724|nr:hypothetical protein [Cellulomonas pakistanensis]